jgi:hypothetical protein
MLLLLLSASIFVFNMAMGFYNNSGDGDFAERSAMVTVSSWVADDQAVSTPVMFDDSHTAAFYEVEYGDVYSRPILVWR